MCIAIISMLLSVLFISGCTESATTPSGTSTTAISTITTTTTGTEGSDALYYNETGFPIAKEPITISVLYPRNALHGDFTDMWFMKEIAKLTNITLIFNLVEAPGFEERKNLAFASGDYPDIFFLGISKIDDMMYGPQGILVDLSQLIEEYAPTLKGIFEDHIDYKKLLTSPDGSIYSVPTFVDIERDMLAGRFYINAQWIRNVGLDIPTNLDELYNVLKAFKNDDPNQSGEADTIPLSSLYRPDGGPEIYIMSALGYVSRRHDIINGEYRFVPMQEEYREYLTYMNKLYADGLLDMEYFTQDSAQIRAKVTEMRVGFSSLNPSDVVQDPEKYQQYTILPALTSAMNSKGMYPAQSKELRGAGTFAMTDKCKYPEAAIRLLDFFFTKDGTRMVRVGPEYGKYEGIDGGWEIYTDDKGVEQTRLKFPGFDGFWQFRHKHGPTSMPFYSSDDIIFLVIGQDPRNQWQSDKVYESGLLDVRRYAYPNIYFTVEESDILATIEVDIDNFIQEMDARFITGDRDIRQDREWDSYIAEINRMGIDEVIRIRQAAYDKWK
jgi:putative aldouronate transport system substrate-binding protein